MNHMSRHFLLQLLALLVSLQSWLGASADSRCPMQQMRVERLADLHVPRIGHMVWLSGDDVVVAGGHTSGFVPTASAECYDGSEWQLLKMNYTHDQGLFAPTAQGDVLVAGGFEKELGIGQTFTLEFYDGHSRQFRGYGCLEKKRGYGRALAIDSCHIIISGNWYADDCIECFDGTRQCQFVKPVSQQRGYPYIMRTAADNAIIFSDCDIHADRFDTIIVDRLHGEPFTVPLFQTWRPLGFQMPVNCAETFVGDVSKGEYVNLFPVMRGDSVMALAKVQGEAFSLLPTTSPIPMRSRWSPIRYFAYPVVDRQAGCVYLSGYGIADNRYYVVSVGYLESPAPVTLYYSEPQDSISFHQPVLIHTGNLLMAGGLTGAENNYEASSRVLLMCVGDAEPAVASGLKGLWWWLVVGLLVAALVVAAGWFAWHRLKRCPKKVPAKVETAPLNTAEASNLSFDEQLVRRIRLLMDDQKLYLRSDLKVNDLANLLDVHRNNVSAAIKSVCGQSFSQFVNNYRVEHAKQLLLDNPEMKISAVAAESGFATEKTFFFNFKALTGSTPSAWMASQK